MPPLPSTSSPRFIPRCQRKFWITKANFRECGQASTESWLSLFFLRNCWSSSNGSSHSQYLRGKGKEFWGCTFHPCLSPFRLFRRRCLWVGSKALWKPSSLGSWCHQEASIPQVFYPKTSHIFRREGSFQAAEDPPEFIRQLFCCSTWL